MPTMAQRYWFLAEKAFTSRFLCTQKPVWFLAGCMATRPPRPLNSACVCSLSVCKCGPVRITRPLDGGGAGQMFYHIVLVITRLYSVNSPARVSRLPLLFVLCCRGHRAAAGWGIPPGGWLVGPML